MIAEFSIIDWLVVIILLISMVSAALKGFVRELVGMGSTLAAFILAAWFYKDAASPFKTIVQTENVALFCGFAIVFLGTLIAGTSIAWLISKVIKAVRLQWFDRCLGALFGLFRGWVLGGIVYLGLTAFHIQDARVRNSELAPYFLPASRMIALVTPSEFKDRFEAGYVTIERWWKTKQ